jgi:hypothetical protein
VVYRQSDEAPRVGLGSEKSARFGLTPLLLGRTKVNQSLVEEYSNRIALSVEMVGERHCGKTIFASPRLPQPWVAAKKCKSFRFLLFEVGGEETLLVQATQPMGINSTVTTASEHDRLSRT